MPTRPSALSTRLKAETRTSASQLQLTANSVVRKISLWENPRRDGLAEIKEYDAKIDTKRRVTLRGACYDHCHVGEYEDGRIELEPRELVALFEVSK